MALGDAPSKIDFSMSEATRVQKEEEYKIAATTTCSALYIKVEEKVKIEIKLIFGD